MISAFGIDHGEVSKAVRMPRGKPTRAQRRTQRRPGARSGPEKIADTGRKISETSWSLGGVGRGASRGLAGASSITGRHPGTTGTALVGGGGYGGYRYLNRKEPRRR